jgi:hypothetical protein
MWQRYCEKREEIRAKRADETLPPFDPPIASDVVARQHDHVFHDLDASINEVYLWHGTSARAALSIAQDDFDIDLAGKGRGTMYGPGAYLAESCTKADEYARDEPGGYYEGVFAVLLCRVCMGKYFYTEERDESAGEKVQSGEYDSTLGDRAKAVGTFRELVVYDNDHLYPEYIILYTRVHESDDPEELEALARTEFHMQLPAYWANCHMNPLTSTFNLQVYVRKRTLKMLQHILAKTMTSDGTNRVPKVVSARRVENSVVWNKYVSHKRRLESRVAELRGRALRHSQSGEEFLQKANVLDGNDLSGHVQTDVVLNQLHSEDCISYENIDSRLNEHMLWHVTSKDNAETIALNDFKIQGSSWFTRRDKPRFGKGAYFDEQLSMEQLSEAEGDSPADGVRWVLFCRVCCGDFYYTEEESETDAHKKCKAAEKGSILANPSGSGPRQFVVVQEDCVYPEFLLELDIDGQPDLDMLIPDPAPEKSMSTMRLTRSEGWSQDVVMAEVLAENGPGTCDVCSVM